MRAQRGDIVIFVTIRARNIVFHLQIIDAQPIYPSKSKKIKHKIQQYSQKKKIFHTLELQTIFFFFKKKYLNEICWFDEACTASSQPQDATTSDRSPLKICEVEDEETMITPITTGFYFYFYFFNLLFWLWRLTEYLKYWGPVWWRRLTITWQIQKVWAVNLRGLVDSPGHLLLTRVFILRYPKF